MQHECHSSSFGFHLSSAILLRDCFIQYPKLPSLGRRHTSTRNTAFSMSSQDISENEKDVRENQNHSLGGLGGKDARNPDLTKQTSLPELRQIASNTLSRVASRLTTRSIIDPGPPPDGGIKAWIQVAMAWVVCFCTW